MTTENSTPQNPAPQDSGPVAASAPQGLRILEALKFLFSDQNAFNNLLLAAVMNLIPIVGPIVLMGWHCEIIQRLCKRHSRPIPKLDFGDFLYYLGRGVAPFVVVLILVLPLTFLMMLLIFGTSFIMGFFFQMANDQGGNPGLIIPLLIGGIMVVFLLFIIPLNVLMVCALLRAELTEDIGKSLEFNKIFAFARVTWKDFVIVYIVMIPLSFMLMIGGMMAFFVGIYLTIVIMNITYLHLRWQVYERYLQRGGEAIPIQTKSGPVPSETKLNPQPA